MRPTPERKQQQTPSGTPAGQPQTTTFNAKALPQNTSRQVSWLDCTDNAPSQAPRAQWSTGEAIWQNYSCATARDSHAIPSWLPHYRAEPRHENSSMNYRKVRCASRPTPLCAANILKKSIPRHSCQKILSHPHPAPAAPCDDPPQPLF